jgi:ketosteroid isomerase-like protein
MAVKEHKQNDEAAIKRVIEGGIEAVRNKNIEGVMSLYAPEVVSFDIVPKLALRGSRCIQKRLGRSLLVVPGSDRL